MPVSEVRLFFAGVGADILHRYLAMDLSNCTDFMEF